jgi:DNA-directed RNA polymerase specialized sigma24 family protein
MLSQEQKKLIFDGIYSKDPSHKRWAVESIYKEFEIHLYKKLRYQFPDLSEFEVSDIIQDAFIKLATTESLPQSPDSMASWLIKVAGNGALDLLKKAYRSHEIPIPEDIEYFGDEFESETDVESIINQAPIEESTSVSVGIQDCVDKGINEFAKKNPQNAVVIKMSLDSVPIVDISIVISRTAAATKQFIYESKKKLAPYIEHCLEV